MQELNSFEFETIESVDIELARKDAWEYCLYQIPELFESRPHLKPVAHLFQWMVQKEKTPEHVRRSVIESDFLKYYSGVDTIEEGCVNMPPRAGKSVTVSVVASWALGKFNTKALMRNCCTATLYNKFSYATRDFIRSEKFANVFPGIGLSPDKQNINGWDLTTSSDGAYFGAGVGGTIVGFGATLISITDDLYKGYKDAISPITIENVKSWNASAKDSRCESGCPNLDIGTEWNLNTIMGEGKKNKDYDVVIIIPALINNVSFCEDVMTTKEYLKKKMKADRTDLGKAIWSGEYMQEPTEIAGTMFPVSKLKRFKIADLEKNIENINARIGVVDTADSGTDFFCAPFAYGIVNEKQGIDPDYKFYIVDVIYTQNNIDVTKPKTIEKSIKHKLDYLKIETNSAGHQFYRNLKMALAETSVRGEFTGSHKETRVLMNSDTIMEHFYFRDDYVEDSEYALFIEHLTTYLKLVANQKDDPPDALAALAQFIKKMFG